MKSKLSMLVFLFLALEVSLAVPASSAELVSREARSDRHVEQLEQQIRTLDASVADRLEAQEKLVQAKVDQVSVIAQVLEGGRKDVDWWLSSLAIFLAVASVLAVAIPVILQKRQNRSFENELKRVKETFDQLQFFERDTKDQMRQALSDLHKAQKEIRIHLETAEGAASHAVQLSKEAEKASRTLIDKSPEELGKAADQLRQAKNTTPKMKLVSKALEYAESGQWNEAIARWRALIDIEPESETFWFNLGYSLQKAFSGDNVSYLEQAIDAYAGAVRLKPDMHDALNNWGNAIAKFAEKLPVTDRPAKYTEAIEKFAEAIHIKADMAESWANWGLALSKLAEILPKGERPAKFAEAAAKYAEALRIKPDMYSVYSNWATVLMHWAQLCNEPERTEKMSAARNYLEKAESSEPGLGAYNLACLSALSGELEDAKKWLEKALVLAVPSVNCQQLSTDTDLDGLRELTWFQEYLGKVCSLQKDG